MKTELRNVYSCDHCRKKYVHKGHAEKHEAQCQLNPANKRACIGCVHLESTTAVVGVTYDDDPETYSERKKVLRCSLLGKFVYPPKAEHSKKGAYDMGDVPNEKMPIECEHVKWFE